MEFANITVRFYPHDNRECSYDCHWLDLKDPTQDKLCRLFNKPIGVNRSPDERCKDCKDTVGEILSHGGGTIDG